MDQAVKKPKHAEPEKEAETVLVRVAELAQLMAEAAKVPALETEAAALQAIIENGRKG